MIYLTNKARQDFCSEFMDENVADQRKLLKAAKKLLGVKDEHSLLNTLKRPKLRTISAAILLGKWRAFAMKFQDAKPISQSDRHLVPPDQPVVNANVILRSF